MNAKEEYILEHCFDEPIRLGYQAMDHLDMIAPHACVFSNELLLGLLRENRDTEFGKKHGFESITTYEEYVKKVPVSDYADYEEYIERILKYGEENLLTSRPVVQFVMTSGTTNGPKYIPLVKEAVELSAAYMFPPALSHADKARKEMGLKGMKRGKGIFLINMQKVSYTESGIPVCGISCAGLQKSNSTYDLISTSPREIITPDEYLDSKYLHLLFALREKKLIWILSCYMTAVAGLFSYLEKRWRDLCEDIENGTIHKDVDMSEATRTLLSARLSPDPGRADELRRIFAGGFNRPLLRLIWPEFCYIGSIGSGSFKIHTEKIRKLAGSEVMLNNLVIASSESLIGVSAGCNTEDFLLTPQGAFFEFIPTDPEEGNAICTMKQVKAGHCYELLLTTISGLYRYRLKDVVRITGFHGEIPIVRFSHRTNVFINIAGEKTTEADMQRAIDAFSAKTGIAISEYAAYADFSEEPGRYVVLLEPEEPVDMSRIEKYTRILQSSFCLTAEYRLETSIGSILPLKLYFLHPNTHLIFRNRQIMKGTSPNQIKSVRLLNNPEIREFFMSMTEKSS